MSRLSKTSWALIAVLSLGVALFSYRFLGAHPMMGEDIAANLLRRPWLPVHAGFAATALLLGPFQFLPQLRIRAATLHRNIGKLYVLACLAAAPAGLGRKGGAAPGKPAAQGPAAASRTPCSGNAASPCAPASAAVSSSAASNSTSATPARAPPSRSSAAMPRDRA